MKMRKANNFVIPVVEISKYHKIYWNEPSKDQSKLCQNNADRRIHKRIKDLVKINEYNPRYTIYRNNLIINKLAIPRKSIKYGNYLNENYSKPRNYDLGFEMKYN